MTLPEKYAHDYRDMAMSEEELRKMLEEFADEIRKERVTHCDDINCPECPKVAYEAGVKAERERIIQKLDNPVLVGHESISDKVIASQVNEMWNTFYRDPIIEVIKDSTN